MAGAITDKQYRAALDRGRCAFLMARGLLPADRQVALLMLKWVNRAAALREGRLSCWPGIGTLAREAGLEWRSVVLARQRLRDLGAIVEIAERCPEMGRATSARYGFCVAWMENVEADVEARPEVTRPLTKKEKARARENGDALPATRKPAMKRENTATVSERAPSPRRGEHRHSPNSLEVTPSTKPLEGVDDTYDFGLLDVSKRLSSLLHEIKISDERVSDILMHTTEAEWPELIGRTTTDRRLVEIFRGAYERWRADTDHPVEPLPPFDG